MAVAKKRKGARPAKRAKPARSVRKKTAGRAGLSKAMAKQTPTGLDNENEVDFRPLKTLIKSHIARLRAAKPSDPVTNALRSLERVQNELTGECSPTMVIPTS
jgi:hypothetical protein